MPVLKAVKEEWPLTVQSAAILHFRHVYLPQSYFPDVAVEPAD
jgi:hypothetical protein